MAQHRTLKSKDFHDLAPKNEINWENLNPKIYDATPELHRGIPLSLRGDLIGIFIGFLHLSRQCQHVVFFYLTATK